VRPAGTHLEGCREFPGGKCLPAETRADALRRELFEELDIVAEVGELVQTVTHEYPEKTVQLHFYRCLYAGEPKPMLGQEIRWVTRGELATLPFPEADAKLLELLSPLSERGHRGSV
jgi:8-oxo-dGTP diphosphatase